MDFVINDEFEMLVFLQGITHLINMNEKCSNKKSLRLLAKKIPTLEAIGKDEIASFQTYRTMRIKMKISYHASQKQISILELFINSIVETYKTLRMDSIEHQLALTKRNNESPSIIHDFS